MRNLWTSCELNGIQAIAAAALLAVALFAWANATYALVDRPDVASVDNWLWRLWQLGALLMAFAGVWWLWLNTRRVPWTRSLALGVYALFVFVNTYNSAWFGDHRGNVWEVANPLFIAFASVAAVALWRSQSPAARIGAVLAAALAVVDFVNAYFVDETVIWQIMNPLMIMAALAWAAGALKTNLAPASDRPSGNA